MLAPETVDPIASSTVSYDALQNGLEDVYQAGFMYTPDNTDSEENTYIWLLSGQEINDHIDELYDGRNEDTEWQVSLYDQAFADDHSGYTIQVSNTFDAVNYIGDYIPPLAEAGAAEIVFVQDKIAYGPMDSL